VVVGLPSKPIQLDIPTNVMYKEAKILGITGREMYDTWFQVIDLIQSRKITPEKVVTHQLAPEKLEEGFKVAKEAQHGKVEFIFG
jgi:threonine 3-dehydrogenase